MLTPKKIVHKKVHKPTTKKGTLKRGSTLAYGEYGLKATQACWLTSRQIEAARKVISRRCKLAKIHIRVFPDKPVTAKGLNIPMGTGTGAINYFMFPVKPGRIIFEVSNAPLSEVKEAFRIAAHKLPFTCKMVSKNDLF